MEKDFFQQDIFGNTVKVILETEEIDVLGPQARSEFNIFALTDAIGARKKRDAWVLYQKALLAGLSPDEVFFKLFWQFKTMLLASRTKTAQEAEMKDYPYSKAKGFLQNFKPGEVEKLLESLVAEYHQARRGEGEIETAVEKIILRL
jgi:DNA polymerase III delta subunit